METGREEEKDTRIEGARIHLIYPAVLGTTEVHLADSGCLPCHISGLKVLMSHKAQLERLAPN
jgi:hypothetical protein